MRFGGRQFPLKTVLALIGTAGFLVLLQFSRKAIFLKYLPTQFPDVSASSCKPKRLHDDISKLYRMYDDVKTFVMFIGCSKTQEGLLGAILDAHPEILLSRDYDTIGNWKMYQDKGLRESGHQKHMLFFFMQYLSNFQTIFKDYMNKPSIFWVWKSSVSSINYNTIPGTWQGRTDGNLKVVGETSGCSTIKKLIDSGEDFTVFKEIQKALDIPLKFIHAVDSPYEVIALNSTQQSSSDGQKSFTPVFQESIKEEFAVLDITTKQLTTEPRKTLKRICNFLEIHCTQSYFNKVQHFLQKTEQS